MRPVLSVIDCPQFFSREDDEGFGFDRERAEGQIRTVQPRAEDVPVLRTAQPLDRDAAMAAGPVLAEDEVLRALDEPGVHEADAAERLKGRTVSGEFRRIRDCPPPGKAVPADGSRDARIAVDMEFHDPDRPTPRDPGLREGPVTGVDPREEERFEEYREHYHRRYCGRLPPDAPRPRLETMRFDGSNPAGPLHPLLELSDEGGARFLNEPPPHGLVAAWRMRVGSQGSTRTNVLSPLKWIAQKYGRLQTSRGIRPATRAVGPLLRGHEDVLPGRRRPSGRRAPSPTSVPGFGGKSSRRRPAYGPNAYRQMIGRGLRGPKNGGKETCLILDVADNITNHHKRLAFTRFEHLWSRR